MTTLLMEEPDRPGRHRNKQGTGVGSALAASALGLQVAFSVVIGFAIGYGLDRLFHTSPFLMMVFILLGLASGILSIVRAVRNSSSQ